MTTEEKELLMKDLCARLPYKVKLQKINEPDKESITLIDYANNN